MSLDQLYSFGGSCPTGTKAGYFSIKKFGISLVIPFPETRAENKGVTFKVNNLDSESNGQGMAFRQANVAVHSVGSGAPHTEVCKINVWFGKHTRGKA